MKPVSKVINVTIKRRRILEAATVCSASKCLLCWWLKWCRCWSPEARSLGQAMTWTCPVGACRSIVWPATLRTCTTFHAAMPRVESRAGVLGEHLRLDCGSVRQHRPGTGSQPNVPDTPYIVQVKLQAFGHVIVRFAWERPWVCIGAVPLSALSFTGVWRGVEEFLVSSWNPIDVSSSHFMVLILPPRNNSSVDRLSSTHNTVYERPGKPFDLLSYQISHRFPLRLHRTACLDDTTTTCSKFLSIVLFTHSVQTTLIFFFI